MTPDTALHRPPNHRRRRYWGMWSLVAVILAAIGVIVSLAAGIYPVDVEKFDVVARRPYVHTYDPIYLAEHGLPPNSSHANVLPATPEVRALTVYPDRVELRSGARSRSIHTNKPITSLHRLMTRIDDPTWIEQTAPGIVTLKTALITQHTKLDIGGPRIGRVNMLDMPSVFIGTYGGELNFHGVTVTSVDTTEPGSEYYQPFVMATDHATLNATNSRFTRLGWDWNASYGVSWELGSTGVVSGTSFDHNFIGVYTGESHDIVFRHSQFNHNRLYGLDPHSGSSNLTIDSVVTKGNGAHGIIFSDGVVDSVIKNSLSSDNGENGIMMDKKSIGNRIVNNTVIDNVGDGLVTAASPGNSFAYNHVENNRVGVRLDSQDTDIKLTGNAFYGNALASENVALDPSNSLAANGGQWKLPVLRWTLVTWGICVLVFALLLWYLTKRQDRRHAQSLHAVAS